MKHVSKQSSLEMALLLNVPGELRTYLVCLINRAYGNDVILESSELINRLEFLSKNDRSNFLVALLHYITCLSLESIELKQTKSH